MVSWLSRFWTASCFSTCNHFCCCDNTYLTAGFVKVVNVVIKDPIFSYHFLYKMETISNNHLILALGPLIVVLAIKFGFNLWTTVDKVCGPVLANRGRVAFCKEKIGHILHILRLGRKSTRI